MSSDCCGAGRPWAISASELAEGEEAHGWLSAYSRLQPGYVRAFEDVLPFLDVLDAAGIPYGAVSNNVHDYQRVKLDSCRAGTDPVPGRHRHRWCAQAGARHLP